MLGQVEQYRRSFKDIEIIAGTIRDDGDASIRIELYEPIFLLCIVSVSVQGRSGILKKSTF